MTDTQRGAEKYRAERIALRERLVLGREMREMSVEQLASEVGCSTGLIRMIEEDWASVTHPAIAARILAECGVRDPKCLIYMTARRRWATLPKSIPKPKREQKPKKKPERKPAGVVINFEQVFTLCKVNKLNLGEACEKLGHARGYLYGRQRDMGTLPEDEARKLAEILGVEVREICK